MSRWFGQRKRRRRPAVQPPLAPPPPRQQQPQQFDQERQQANPPPQIDSHHETDNQRRQAIEDAFYNTGLVRKSVFSQQNPQFSQAEIDRFYEEDPITKQYYGGKRDTKRSEQKVFSPHNLNRIQLDLAEFRGSPYPFCLVAVCCYSRYAWVKKLKSKAATDMVPALTELCIQWTNEKILPSHSINALVDAGLEFFSKQAKQLFQRYNIGLYKLQSSEAKACVAERFIRTLRKLLNMLVLREPQGWELLADKAVQIYNHTPNRGIFMQTPHNIYFRDPEALAKLREKLRIKKPLHELEKVAAKALQHPKIKRLDFVHIMTKKSNLFAKGSDMPPISRECFIVDEVKPSNIGDVSRLPMVRLRDIEFNPIIGEILQEPIKYTKIIKRCRHIILYINIYFYFFLFTGLFKASEVVKINENSPNHPLNPNFKPTISKIIKITQQKEGRKIKKFYHCKLAEFPPKKTYRLTQEEFNSFPKDHEAYLYTK